MKEKEEVQIYTGLGIFIEQLSEAVVLLLNTMGF